VTPPFDDEAYRSLLEQGLELQRRHDAVLGSRTWRLQLAVADALRAPSKLLGLPFALGRILFSGPEAAAPAALELPEPPAPLPSEKPLVLALVPWLRVGGAERVVLEIVRGLAGELDFAVLPASTEGGLDPAFAKSAPWIFPPGPDYPARLACILEQNPVDSLLISSCPQAYAALPGLPKGTRVFDILHNAAPEGSLPASVERDRWIDHHFAVGTLQADALRAAKVPNEKITVAHNAVDFLGRFHPDNYRQERPALRSKLGLQDDALLLGWVGRLSEEKDPQLFVRTLAELPEAHGLLIGDGPERFHVEALIHELGLSERACVTGFTSRVPELLSACDAQLLTSRCEGSPLTILEAMSLAKPVIAADIGAVREAVEDGVTGFLIGERTPEAFAAAVGRLAGNPGLGDNARRRVVEHFSLERMLDVYRAKLIP
jgi:glycosyltransferase involved in cell wall biosynthesis